jgi:hypothetical protein
MRKLKLEVGDLQVDSFSIPGSYGRVGTIHGRVTTWQQTTEDPGATIGTCIGPTYCCGATGPTNPVCIGPSYCCNPTANTGCCAPATDACPGTGYHDTCEVSCPFCPF